MVNYIIINSLGDINALSRITPTGAFITCLINRCVDISSHI